MREVRFACAHEKGTNTSLITKATVAAGTTSGHSLTIPGRYTSKAHGKQNSVGTYVYSGIMIIDPIKQEMAIDLYVNWRKQIQMHMLVEVLYARNREKLGTMMLSFVRDVYLFG